MLTESRNFCIPKYQEDVSFEEKRYSVNRTSPNFHYQDVETKQGDEYICKLSEIIVAFFLNQ